MGNLRNKKYTSIELFAGAGGMAIGMEKAGFTHILLNELDKNASNTLRLNRPHWNVVNQDIRQIDFSHLNGQIDLLAGGFPCQAFSVAGQSLGFKDTRGTLFFEFARAVKEIQPKVFIAENVKGLVNHDAGKTLNTIKTVINELGYKLISPKILNAMNYNVPQKRERIFLIAIRQDLELKKCFEWPVAQKSITTLRDALKAGALYATDVSPSSGSSYSKRKQEIFSMVPQGGCWRDLPVSIQKEYMKTCFDQSGGKTGMARRISWDEPCLTLTCSPTQRQTERCHPEDNRPFQVREYARIQTFPDNWEFSGSMTSQYRQIGNAVPVNLSYAIGLSLVKLLDQLT